MPLYPYRCTKCGYQFEKIQSFNSEPETTCPQCGGALERPLTAPGLQFKGAGWYVNDYASKGGGTKKPDAAESKAPAESKPSESTTESKPSTPAAPAASAPASSSESKS